MHRPVSSYNVPSSERMPEAVRQMLIAQVREAIEANARRSAAAEEARARAEAEYRAAVAKVRDSVELVDQRRGVGIATAATVAAHQEARAAWRRLGWARLELQNAATERRDLELRLRRFEAGIREAEQAVVALYGNRQWAFGQPRSIGQPEDPAAIQAAVASGGMGTRILPMPRWAGPRRGRQG